MSDWTSRRLIWDSASGGGLFPRYETDAEEAERLAKEKDDRATALAAELAERAAMWEMSP